MSPGSAGGSAATIDDVVARLDDEVHRAVREGSRAGYFAALYREVTVRVDRAIRAGRFEDGDRMARLDVVFANRYLDAVARRRAREPVTRSWGLAFDAAQQWPPLILQHLLVGMNAHIGLDLGIAAARTAPGADLPGLRRDFDEITAILGETVDDVQDRIARVSPDMGLLDRFGCRTDEEVCTFALDRARTLAWGWAEHLAGPLAAHRQDEAIARLDGVVAQLGRRILAPRLHLRGAFLLVRMRETQDVAAVVDALRGP